jgi:hypothetical protein
LLQISWYQGRLQHIADVLRKMVATLHTRDLDSVSPHRPTTPRVLDVDALLRIIDVAKNFTRFDRFITFTFSSTTHSFFFFSSSVLFVCVFVCEFSNTPDLTEKAENLYEILSRAQTTSVTLAHHCNRIRRCGVLNEISYQFF